jgi:hypothetical protein
MTGMFLPAVVLCLSAVGAAADATIPTQGLAGARDDPLLKRYDGSFIVSANQYAFDEFLLPLAPLKEDRERRDRHNNIWYAPAEHLELEGRISRLV